LNMDHCPGRIERANAYSIAEQRPIELGSGTS
jgi:hypothetical protein